VDKKMQLELTEEQKMLRAAVRKLAEEEIKPGVRERDEKEEFSWEMVKLLRDNGYLAVDFPGEYGGGDAGMLSLIIVLEELARVDASTSLIPGDNDLGSLPIMLAGSKQVKDKFMPKLCTGEHLSTFALTEPSGGSDVAGFTCRAERKGNEYIINGNKTFITNGGVADICTTYVITDPEKGAYKGASVLALPTKGTPGFSVGKHEIKLGIRASNTVELVFNDMHVPVENLLGKEGARVCHNDEDLGFHQASCGSHRFGFSPGCY
jgi:alkylation response protein AidB-like acyl-CoA dehydrogenase